MRYVKTLDVWLRWKMPSGSSQSATRRINSGGRLRRLMVME